MRITVLAARPGADVMEPASELPARPPTEGWLWVDVAADGVVEPDAAARAIGADPAALGPIRPDAFPGARTVAGALVVVTRSLSVSGDRLATTPLVLVLARGGLMTVRFHELPGLAFLAERARGDATIAADGADLLLARLVDIGAQRFVPLIDELEASVEDLEDRALEAHPDVLTESHALRRDAALLRSVLRVQRDTMRSITRLGTQPLGEMARLRVEEVYDVHVRFVETLDVARQMLSGVIEVYRSTVAERTNEVMKVLTVFAVILLPLGLVAGIYGMNFEHMPELGQRWAYFAVLGGMATIAVGLWLYFAKRGFVGGPRRARTVGRGLVHLAVLPIRTVGALSRGVAGVILPSEPSRAPDDKGR